MVARLKTPSAQTATVELSNGLTVKVGLIRWRGWVAVKNKILELVQDQAIQKILQKLVEISSKAPSPGEQDDDVAAGASVISSLVQDRELLEELSKIVPEALNNVLRGWDEVTLELIGSTVEPDQPDLPIEESQIAEFITSLPARDLMKLRDAALELNDLSELVEMEKNSILGMFRQVFVTQNEDAQSNGTKKESSPTGGAPTSSY